MKAGHFSAKIPGQLSAEINTAPERQAEALTKIADAASGKL
jgi:hypothetical protein